MAGHPQGLTTKVSFAEVFSEPGTLRTFRAGLAAMRGSEGSPILDFDTGEVVGVHQSNLNNRVQENRFRGCSEAKVCAGEDCFLEQLVPTFLFRKSVEKWNEDPETTEL